MDKASVTVAVIIAAIFSNMFANIGVTSNSQNYGMPIIQTANAANIINNQNTSTNVNCDNTSSCGTSPANTQTGSVGSGGDGNEINQNLVQRNEQCTDFSACQSSGTQQAGIVNNFDGFVIDAGSGNTNTQINSNDNEVGNENRIDHQLKQENSQCSHFTGCHNDGFVSSDIGDNRGAGLFITGNGNNNTQLNQGEGSRNSNVVGLNFEQKNKACQDFTDCGNNVGSSLDIGSIFGGGISDSGNDNANIQNNLQKNSANENIVSGIHAQENNNCSRFCHNLISGGGNIATIVGLGIFADGVNGTNLQSALNIGDGSRNKINDISTQENSNCDFCDNIGGNTYSIGSIQGLIFSGAISDQGNNNTNTNNVVQKDSNNENTISNQQIQKNKDCTIGFTACRNLADARALIGAASVGSLSSTGSNNADLQNTTHISSGTSNSINNFFSGQNLGCNSGSGCDNIGTVTHSVGATFAPFSDNSITNSGDNNRISQSQTSNNSNNNNQLYATINQDNKFCQGAITCANTAVFNTDIGTTQNGLIVNTGNDSSISDSIIVLDSNNNNKITQEVDQHNQNCDNLVIGTCGNGAVASSIIGHIKSNDISNSQDNQSISQATIISDTNNQNNIAQKIVQNNLCRTSICVNSANLTATINGENNQNIDQNLGQNNLCVKTSSCINDGKVIGVSGSNSQSNICVDGSSCNSSGTNNKNTCFDGATCNNTGVDTKVISHGDSCNNGADGTTTICSHGRIITISNNPNLVP